MQWLSLENAIIQEVTKTTAVQLLFHSFSKDLVAFHFSYRCNLHVWIFKIYSGVQRRQTIMAVEVFCGVACYNFKTKKLILNPQNYFMVKKELENISFIINPLPINLMLTLKFINSA